MQYLKTSQQAIYISLLFSVFTTNDLQHIHRGKSVIQPL